MFERGILVMTLICNRKRTMQGLFKALRKSRHSRPLWPPAIIFAFYGARLSRSHYPPAIMIAVDRSGNNNLYHGHIVAQDRGERPVPSIVHAAPNVRFPHQNGLASPKSPSELIRHLSKVKSAPDLRIPAATAAGAGLANQPPIDPADYFFSITHCSGCWCLRAKSITCVTLV